MQVCCEPAPVTESPHRKFGKSVYRLRMKAGFTQEHLSERAEISRRFLQEIEAGQKNPTVNVIHRLKAALKCGWGDLLD